MSLEGWEDFLGEKETEVYTQQRPGKQVRRNVQQVREHLHISGEFLLSLSKTISPWTPLFVHKTSSGPFFSTNNLASFKRNKTSDVTYLSFQPSNM